MMNRNKRFGARARGDGFGFDPFVLYFAHRAYVTVRATWRACVEARGFEPRGAALAAVIVFAERALRWVPVGDAHGVAERMSASHAICPRAFFALVERRGFAEALPTIVQSCFLATCVHVSDAHAIYNLGSLFLKLSELEGRIRASATREASTAATVAFALVLGALTNAVAVASAKYVMTDAYNTCVVGSNGLLFALKTYRALADHRDGVRGRVSFFGFIDAPSNYAALIEIAILYMLDHSSASLNLYLSGCVVGFAFASFERRAMALTASAATVARALLGGIVSPSVRVNSRVVLRDMRNASLNGQWGVVIAVNDSDVSVLLDVDARRVSALRSQLIVV